MFVKYFLIFALSVDLGAKIGAIWNLLAKERKN